jgi:SAM-dependent methyltransferase
MLKLHLARLALLVIPVLARNRYRNRLSYPLGSVNLGNLDRVHPISDEFGFDRGQPVDRFYIENFLAKCAADIKGHVLEFGDNTYTRRFGGKHVRHSDVMDVDKENEQATVIGDLVSATHIPSDTFDCIVCTQTLGFIYDVHAAVKTLHRILKPGGVLLVTVNGIGRLGRYDMEHYGVHWRFTSASLRRVLEERFPAANINLETCGNVYAAIAFLEGLAVEELNTTKLQSHDPYYQVTITARAVKC